MLRVYLETTIPSYLTARPSRDLVVAAHQKTTRDWWDEKRQEADLYVSTYVLEEASTGGDEAAGRRMGILDGITVLEVTPEAEAVAAELVTRGHIPSNAVPDAFHIAIATAHEIDVLLTWNCKHLANPTILREVYRTLRGMGYEPPIVCTPDELMGEDSDD